ncbi:MAG: hypothetical protein ABEJ98_00650 [Candidatus Nanohaloarchaea archaeon]
MVMLYLESETPDGMEEEFEESMIDATQDYAGFNINEFDYEVEAGDHFLYVDVSKGPKVTGEPGKAPEFEILEAESQEELEDLVDALEEPETKGRKMRKQKVSNSSYSVDEGTHYQACIIEKGPWLS